jgi:hypothetical protein
VPSIIYSSPVFFLSYSFPFPLTCFLTTPFYLFSILLCYFLFNLFPLFRLGIVTFFPSSHFMFSLFLSFIFCVLYIIFILLGFRCPSNFVCFLFPAFSTCTLTILVPTVILGNLHFSIFVLLFPLTYTFFCLNSCSVLLFVFYLSTFLSSSLSSSIFSKEFYYVFSLILN